MIRMTELPVNDLDTLLLPIYVQCVYMHLAEQKDMWECESHTHTHCEFGYVYKGRGVFHIDGTDYEVTAGDLFVIPQGVSHYEVHDEHTPFEIMFLMVKHHGERSEELDQLLYELRGKAAIVQTRRLKMIMDDIYEEIGGRHKGYLSMIDGKLKSLYVLLLRQTLPEADKSEAAAGDRSSIHRNKQVIAQVETYLEENYTTRCTVETVAQHFFYHPKYLSALYKKETGLALSEYIARKRMERTKTWLAQTNMPIELIADKLGFSSPQHLYKRFKQDMNMTPLQYRKLAAELPQDPF